MSTAVGQRAWPEDVAWAILALCDPRAAFVTGVLLPVDGGAVVG
ncbi:SDR family oxidoreductase [Micromonospora citrea]